MKNERFKLMMRAIRESSVDETELLNGYFPYETITSSLDVSRSWTRIAPSPSLRVAKKYDS